MEKVVLVTGASAGIGKATALELIRAGHLIYGAARRVPKMDDIRDAGGHALAMDARRRRTWNAPSPPSSPKRAASTS